MTVGFSSVAVSLPPLCGLLLCVLFQRSGMPLANALLMAAITCGGLLAGVTELLSAFNGLTYWWVAGSWLLLLILLVSAAPLAPNRGRPFTLPEFESSPARWTVAGVACIVCLTGLTALVAPPNNFDSMTYHLGRVVHWLQNHSVQNYPTHLTRQLYAAPWAEYGLLHLHLLSGGDRFDNLIQWTAMLGCLLVVYRIARQLGGGQSAALYAVAVTAAIPMGILQSSSTQNDYVTAFWLACFVWASLLPRERAWGVESLAMGASLGLAIFTKGTAYPFAFPFLVWAVLRDLRLGTGRALHQLLPVVLLVLAINSGHYLRTYQTFGRPITTDSERLASELIGIRPLAATMTRNLAMQFATPIKTVNRAIESAVTSACQAIGSDRADSRTCLTPFSLRPLVQLHEDFAVNPLHTLLITASLCLVLMNRALRREQLLRNYSLTALGAFMLFSLLLKWQPFGNRLMLPLFVLWAPAVGIVLGRLGRGWPANSATLLLLLCSLPWLLYNTSRPLLPVPDMIMKRLAPGKTAPRSILATERIEQYYANKPEFRLLQETAAARLVARGCNPVGLQVGSDYWEYTLWVQLARLQDPPRLEHLAVQNLSARGQEPAVRQACRVLSDRKNMTHLAVEQD